MLSKNHILDQIIDIIVREKEFIEKKNKLGLFDDNKHWENIIRKILNDSLGYELENLNRDKSNYPGIDLGDSSNGIGIQVTTTKTSAKIKNTLEKMLKEKVYEEYNYLKVFILGDKQDSYTVDMQPYEGKIHFNVNKDIWDFQDLLTFMNDMNTTELTNILTYLQEEFGVGDGKQQDISETSAMVIINYLNDAKRWAEIASVEGRTLKGCCELEDAHNVCKEVIGLLSTQEYSLLCELFESIGNLLKEMNNQNGTNQILSSYKLKFYGNAVLQKWSIYDVLCTKCNVRKGYLFNMIIDMDTFESRINALGIDNDIIQQQFSMENFKCLLEEYKMESCDNIIVVYKEESDLLKRIAQSKKVVLECYEEKATAFKKILNLYKKRAKEFVVSTNDQDLLNVFGEYRAEGVEIVGINFDNDLHWKLKGQFFDIIELQDRQADFFSYNEEIFYDIRRLTKEDYRKMIANASDKVDHQLRVSKGGEVWISRIVAAEDIADLQFRWETYDAYNAYTGPRAASDKEYINETYNELKWDWDNGKKGYIDLWLAPPDIYT